MSNSPGQNADRLISLLKDHSLLLCRAQFPHAAIIEHREEGPVKSHWMTLVLISSSSLSVTFKAHFKSRVALSMAAASRGESADSLTIGQGLDFFKEFCNMIAGGLKHSLSSAGVAVGISLPVMTRGYDEVNARFLMTPSSHYQAWECAVGEGTVTFSAVVEILGDLDLNKLQEEVSQSDGEVEFF